MKWALACILVACVGAACGGDSDAGGPNVCTSLPTSTQYQDCTPVGSDTPACLGSDELEADPGHENTRYPVGCTITYPVCDAGYGVPYNCECQSNTDLPDGAEWWCPV